MGNDTIKLEALPHTVERKEKQLIRIIPCVQSDSQCPTRTMRTKVMVGDQEITGVTQITLIACVNDVWRAQIECFVLPEEVHTEAVQTIMYYKAPRPRIWARIVDVYRRGCEKLGSALDLVWPIEKESEDVIKAKIVRAVVSVDTTSMDSTAMDFRLALRPKKSLRARWDALVAKLRS